MSLAAENLLVLLIVAGAGAYLARMAWRTLTVRRAKACGGCSNCAGDGPSPQVVSIERPAIKHQAAWPANGATHPR